MKNKTLLLIGFVVVMLLVAVVLYMRKGCPEWVNCMPGTMVDNDCGVSWYCIGRTQIAW